MKTSTIAPAVIACLMSLALTNAGPVEVYRRDIADSGVDALYVRDIEAEIFARAAALVARGGKSSKVQKIDSKASYPVGNNKAETPTGEFRKFTAGRHDDYFGDWQTMTGGKGKSAVKNPAAGKGKKPKGKRDLFDEAELDARGGMFSKIDSKASYPVGKNRPETPTGEFRKFTAGRHDDYFGDWQTMTGGKGKSAVRNPAAGRGKRPKGKRDLFDEAELEARGGMFSKIDSKASYPVGKNRPETPTGEFRKFTAGRHDDYFADWQTMTGGKGKSAVRNPAAGRGKRPKGKRDLFDEAELVTRGGKSSKVQKIDSKASYPVGNNKAETPTGEFRKFTAGRHDDYFGDWQTMTGGKGKSGVNNPAAGKGKKPKGKRDLFDEAELDARGGVFSKIDSKASYSVGRKNRPETPTGEFRKFTAGRHDDYFADWQTMTGGQGKSGVNNPAAGKGKKPKGKRDFFDDAELEARDLFDFELEELD